MENLFDKKGEIKNSGFLFDELVNANLETIKKPKKLKIWHKFCVEDQTFAFFIKLIKVSNKNFVQFILVDKFREEVNKKIFKLKDIDFNFNKDLKLANDEFELDIKNKENQKHLSGKVKDFFLEGSVDRDLNFSISLNGEKERANAIFNLEKNQFIFSHKCNWFSVSGNIRNKGRLYSIDSYKNCGVLEEYGSAILPKFYNDYSVSISNVDSSLAINLGTYNSEEADVCEGYISYKGQKFLTGKIKVFSGQKDNRAEALSPWTFYAENGTLELMFDPEFMHKTRVGSLSNTAIFGKFSGKINLGADQFLSITNIEGKIEDIGCIL